jgi:hypothetical protein
MSTQAGEPTEAELRAYEEELSQITSTQLVVQAAASLLNIGGRRLGLAEGAEQERDLEQVRDAIDAVRGLLPILERRMPAAQARPLREALSQLQMAYARLAQATASAEPPPAEPSPERTAAEQPAATTQQPSREAASGGQEAEQGSSEQQESSGSPGPAERSGRLWVPGR